MAEMIYQPHLHVPSLPVAISHPGEVWRCDCGKRFVSVEEYRNWEWHSVDPIFHPILFWKTLTK